MQNKLGTKFLVIVYIYCRSPSQWKLIFQSPDTLAVEADIRDMFKKTCKRGSTFTVVVPPDHCLLLHQFSQLQRLLTHSLLVFSIPDGIP